MGGFPKKYWENKREKRKKEKKKKEKKKKKVFFFLFVPFVCPKLWDKDE